MGEARKARVAYCIKRKSNSISLTDVFTDGEGEGENLLPLTSSRLSHITLSSVHQLFTGYVNNQLCVSSIHQLFTGHVNTSQW